MAHMYDVRGRIRLRCAACGSVKTPKWRKVGVRYGYMTSFFTAGKGAKNTLDHLSKNGGSLHTDSDICNRCWLLFRNNGEGTNISAEAYIAIIEAEPVGERPTAVAGRHVAVQLLGHISRGEVVSLERCTSMLRAELQRAGGVIGEQTLLRRAKELMNDLADHVEDAYVQTFYPSELDQLYDNDGRKTYTFLAPRVIKLSYVVQLELNMMHVDKELKNQHIPHVGAGVQEGESAEPERLDVVKKAGEIVLRDIRNSRLNCGKRGAISSELHTNIPDTLRYVCEQFPRSLLTLLAYCIGKGHLVSEATGDRAETTVEDKPRSTDEVEGGNTDAVMVYFWGTAIARAVLGPRYFPPHYLKLSQVFKVSTHDARP